MNRWPRGRIAPGAKMLKLTLVALFVMSMATLTIAASALPVETVPVTQFAEQG